MSGGHDEPAGAATTAPPTKCTQVSPSSARFHRDGYAVYRGVLDPGAVTRLRDCLEPFRARTADNPLSTGGMQFASNVYRDSEELRALSCSPVVVAILDDLGHHDAWLRWDQAVWKAPAAPVFPWHQDNGYTQLGHEHLQLWIPLTEMRRENGGLLVLPGQHRERYDHRSVGGHVVARIDHDGIAVDASPGDIVAFSSYLPHMTGPNTTTETRLAYVAEFLPLDVADPSVEPMHWAVVDGGHACGEFRDLTRRWLGSSG
jgi:ectoine hydroxylase-related dioxygenase (phytanoyl-CoA dioxygenase family)